MVGVSRFSRLFRRFPGAVSIICFSLAVGAGINAAVFVVLDQLLFGPRGAVPDPSSLVRIFTSDFNGRPFGRSSFPDYHTISGQVSAFAEVAFVKYERLTVEYGSLREDLGVATVPPNYISLVGLRLYAGGLPDARDRAIDREAIVSFDFWTHAGQGRDFSDQYVAVGSSRYHVVGVAPRGFLGLDIAEVSDVWLISAGDLSAQRGNRDLSLIARLTSSQSLRFLQDKLDRVGARLSETFPTSNRGTQGDANSERRFTVVQYSPFGPDSLPRALQLKSLLYLSSFLLALAAWINAASVTLSTFLRRQPDQAIKRAIGASSRILIHEIGSESLVLATVGVCVASLLTLWFVSAAPSFFPPDYARFLVPTADGRLAVVAIGAIVVGSAAIGLVPVLTSVQVNRRASEYATLIARYRTKTVRRLFVLIQVACTTALVAATIELRGAASEAIRSGAGADPGRTLVAAAILAPSTQPRDLDPLIAEIRTFSGVRTAAWTTRLPLGQGAREQYGVQVMGTAVADSFEADVTYASPSLTDALGMSVIDGQFFSDTDLNVTEPMVVVDDVLAEQYLRGSSANVRLVDNQGNRMLVKGVVRNGKYLTVEPMQRPMIFRPLSGIDLSHLFLIVRLADNEPQVLALTERRIRQHVSIVWIQPLGQYLKRAVPLDSLVSGFISGSASLTGLLAAIGMIFVVNDDVFERRREIAIRLAIGGGPGAVIKLLFRDITSASLIGVAVGALAALGFKPVCSSLLGRWTVEPVHFGVIALASVLCLTLVAIQPLRAVMRLSLHRELHS